MKGNVLFCVTYRFPLCHIPPPNHSCTDYVTALFTHTTPNHTHLAPSTTPINLTQYTTPHLCHTFKPHHTHQEKHTTPSPHSLTTLTPYQHEPHYTTPLKPHHNHQTSHTTPINHTTSHPHHTTLMNYTIHTTPTHTTATNYTSHTTPHI